MFNRDQRNLLIERWKIIYYTNVDNDLLKDPIKNRVYPWELVVPEEHRQRVLSTRFIIIWTFR